MNGGSDSMCRLGQFPTAGDKGTELRTVGHRVQRIICTQRVNFAECFFQNFSSYTFHTLIGLRWASRAPRPIESTSDRP